MIESEQGALVSRAILVLPMSNVETGNTLMAHIEQETLFSCRNGISVTEECSKKNLVIGDQTIYNVCNLRCEWFPYWQKSLCASTFR